MLRTYKAILRGSRLEWSEEAPEHPERQAVEVHVTILKDTATSSSAATQGKKMAEVLEKLASTHALSKISDPSAWQREQRQDRPLPTRDV